MITYKTDQAAIMLLYTSQDANFDSSERCLSCSPDTVMIACGMIKQPLLIQRNHQATDWLTRSMHRELV